MKKWKTVCTQYPFVVLPTLFFCVLLIFYVWMCTCSRIPEVFLEDLSGDAAVLDAFPFTFQEEIQTELSTPVIEYTLINHKLYRSHGWSSCSSGIETFPVSLQSDGKTLTICRSDRNYDAIRSDSVSTSVPLDMGWSLSVTEDATGTVLYEGRLSTTFGDDRKKDLRSIHRPPYRNLINFRLTKGDPA